MSVERLIKLVILSVVGILVWLAAGLAMTQWGGMGELLANKGKLPPPVSERLGHPQRIAFVNMPDALVAQVLDFDETGEFAEPARDPLPGQVFDKLVIGVHGWQDPTLYAMGRLHDIDWLLMSENDPELWIDFDMRSDIGDEISEIEMRTVVVLNLAALEGLGEAGNAVSDCMALQIYRALERVGSLKDQFFLERIFRLESDDMCLPDQSA